jgi:hypothetical protein
VGQVETLTKNIDILTATIYKLKEKTFLTPSIPQIDISSMVMTPRQIAKRVLLVSSGLVNVSGQITQNVTTTGLYTAQSLGIDTTMAQEALNSPDALATLTATKIAGMVTTEEEAHLIVYGKIMRDANGKIIDNEKLYPECVEYNLGMPKIHPTLTEVKKYVNLATKAIKMIGIKEQDLLDDIMQAAISIPANITAMVSAVAIMPPGSGLPVAFAAFQSMVATIMGLTAKITDIVNILPDLEYVPLVLPKEIVDAVLIPVNVILTALNTIMGTIDTVTSLIPSSSSLSSMTGGAAMPPAAYVGGTVSGTVKRSNDNVPIPNVTVTAGNKPSVKTDASGKYTVEKVDTGNQEVTAYHASYQDYSTTVSVQNDQTITVDILLLPL